MVIGLVPVTKWNCIVPHIPGCDTTGLSFFYFLRNQIVGYLVIAEWSQENGLYVLQYNYTLIQRFGELYCKTYSNDRSTQGRKSMRIYSFQFHGSLIISMKGIALFISLIFFHSMFFRRRIEAHMINFRKERLAVIGKLSLVAVNRNLAFASHQELRV